MSDAGTPPQAIDAIPLKHPWRWVAAAVVLIFAFLFVYGAATNQAYRWPVFAKYLFNERVLTVGLFNTLQLTVYSMVLAVALGVLLAVMRLSPNPVFRWVSWLYLWIFRGTPIYVQLVFWGLIPTIYQQLRLGVPFGPTFFHRGPAEPVDPVPARDARPGAQRGGLHGRDHPRRHQLRSRGPDWRRRRRWACPGVWPCGARCCRRPCG